MFVHARASTLSLKKNVQRGAIVQTVLCKHPQTKPQNAQIASNCGHKIRFEGCLSPKTVVNADVLNRFYWKPAISFTEDEKQFFLRLYV